MRCYNKLMSRRSVDISGKRFGKLTAIKSLGRFHYEFKCDCGSVVKKRKCHVTSGNTKSCGCARRKLPCKKDGTSYIGSKTYRCWSNMLSRCNSKNNPNYQRYGGRGIKVCDRWKIFANFLEDMGDKPSRLSLDRIDNNKGYSKENCRWATTKEQSRNTRANIVVEYEGKKYILSDLSRKLGIPAVTLKRRYRRGLQLLQRAKTIRLIKTIDLSEYKYTGDRAKDMTSLRGMGCTLQQIGDTYGITRERVRQLLDRFQGA